MMGESDKTGRVAKAICVFRQRPPSSGSSARISCFETSVETGCQAREVSHQ